MKKYLVIGNPIEHSLSPKLHNHRIEENNIELNKNLDTAILLDPNNEEIIYMLIDIELKKSNFSKVKELNKKFKLICSSLCPKISLIDERLNNFQEKNDS